MRSTGIDCSLEPAVAQRLDRVRAVRHGLLHERDHLNLGLEIGAVRVIRITGLLTQR